jgi:hypothetical protein
VNARLVAGIAGAVLLVAAGWFVRPQAEHPTEYPTDLESPRVAAGTPVPPAAAASAPTDSASASRHEPPGESPSTVGTFESVHDPNGDARLLAHVEKQVSRIYEDVRTELGLDADQNELLFALLVDHEMRRLALEIPDSPESLEAYEALESQFERELADQLGPERAGRFAKYRYSENARYEVEDVRRLLDRASAPLTETQRKTMIRLAIERGAYVPPAKPGADAFGSAVLQEAYARFEQRDQKLMNVARRILDPGQIALLERAYQERQRAYDEMVRNAGEFESR